MKKHSKALVFFALSKQIPIVYSAEPKKGSRLESETPFSEVGSANRSVIIQIDMHKNSATTYIYQ